MELRQYVDKGLQPIARKVTITPNTITLISLLAMAGAAGLAITGNLVWAGLLILVSGSLDLLDGSVARASGRATPFGALLDRVVDRAADFMIVAGIMLGGHVDPGLGLYVLFTMLLASYISACLEAATASTIGSSISLRAVRLVVLALACLTGMVVEGMILLAVISTYATGTRLHLAYRILR